MPEYNNSMKDIGRGIQQYFSSRDGYVKQEDVDMKKDVLKPPKAEKSINLSSPLHDRGHVRRETTTKKARAKESSKHFGVRFRPDLQKWVAEIRVAEWKTVDKKVWLGTFETEEGAARAVDAARKLLKCKKKRLPNFPCTELDTFSEQLPPHLNLNNLGNDAMYKAVTIFIKIKAQQYAASFYTARSFNFAPKHAQAMISDTSSRSPLQLPHASSHEEMSLDSQDSFPSYESWADEGAWPLRSDEVAHDHLQFGDSTSPPFDLASDLIPCNQPHHASHSVWEDTTLFPEDLEGYALPNNLVTSSEYLIPSDNQEYNYAQDQTMSAATISEQMWYDNFSLFGEWSFQKPSSGTIDSSMDWNHWMLHNSPSGGLDCTQVC